MKIFNNNKQFIEWLDKLILFSEVNFQKALVRANSEPVNNPYQWNENFRKHLKEATLLESMKFYKVGYSPPLSDHVVTRNYEIYFEKYRLTWEDPEDEWIFQGHLYRSVKEHKHEIGLFKKDEIKLLILEIYDKERQKFERLKQKHT